MTISQKLKMCAFAACIGLAPYASLSFAQEGFPNKTIKMVVPYPPGASTDNVARAFAKELGKELKVTVVVENRPGGGTTIGALAVRNSPADGYSLLFQVDGLYNGKLSAPTVAYEFSDFEIISPLAQTPYAMVVPAKNNITNLDDLKTLAKTKKGEVDFGVLGIGVNQYSILAKSLSKTLGFAPRLIPYKGGVEGITAVMTGEIDAYFATVGLASSHKNNDKIKIVALTSDAGSNKFVPGIKSFSEFGVKDMVFRSLYGVAIRSNTPNEIKNKLLLAAAKVVNSDEMKKARELMSLEDYVGTLEAYKAEVQLNLKNYQAAMAAEKTNN